jgi:hypothetical protein
MAIINPNSSGQGYDKDHDLSRLASIARKFGYEYSHSTPIVQNPCSFSQMKYIFGGKDLSGKIHNLHTWKYPGTDHSVSYYSTLNVDDWTTQCNCSSSVQFKGNGALMLERHLKSKHRRYRLSQGA